ncbi:hypothetical protein AB0O34_25770 [Sphaerisporangium sp. NPDC088356]|uniref:hypothetical protein n=1 Tax=Sphaerisporangium sp. NPDC088356 TaxID=3154871 RepID=UPI00343601C5
MSGRVLKWAGGALFAGAAITMGVYFARVGLDDADRSASVIGAFIGLAGLVLALCGTFGTRRTGRAQAPPEPMTRVAPGGTPPGDQNGTGRVRNEITGGTFHAPVIQGRDMRGVAPGAPTPQSPVAPSAEG